MNSIVQERISEILVYLWKCVKRPAKNVAFCTKEGSILMDATIAEKLSESKLRDYERRIWDKFETDVLLVVEDYSSVSGVSDVSGVKAPADSYAAFKAKQDTVEATESQESLFFGTFLDMYAGRARATKSGQEGCQPHKCAARSANETRRKDIRAKRKHSNTLLHSSKRPQPSWPSLFAKRRHGADAVFCVNNDYCFCRWLSAAAQYSLFALFFTALFVVEFSGLS